MCGMVTDEDSWVDISSNLDSFMVFWNGVTASFATEIRRYGPAETEG